MSQIHNLHAIHSVSSDYNLRLPSLFRHLALIGIVGLLAAVLISPVNDGLTLLILVLALVLLIPTIAVWLLIRYLQAARSRIRDRIVNAVRWRGDEQVLDVGTGSGVMLFGCAKQLTTGKVIGIDLYLPNAGGGTAEIFWKNARLEGLEQKVELQNVDARHMPFENQSFDVIVSSLVLHHIGHSNADREQALREIVRVLKPGGTIALVDIASMINPAADYLRQSGITGIERIGRAVVTIIGRKI